MARYLLDQNPADVVDGVAPVLVVSEDDDYTYTTLIAETYTDEQGIDKPKYALVGYSDSNVTVEGSAVAAFDLDSGTGKADTTGKPSIVYVQITGGTGGTVKVEVAPTGSSTYVTLVAAATGNAVESQVIPVPLPPFGSLRVTVVTDAAIGGVVQYTVN